MDKPGIGQRSAGLVVARTAPGESSVVREAATVVGQLLKDSGHEVISLLDDDARLSKICAELTQKSEGGTTVVFAFVGPYLTSEGDAEDLAQRACLQFDRAIFALSESLTDGLYAKGTEQFDSRLREAHVLAAIGYLKRLRLPPRPGFQFWRSRPSTDVEFIFQQVLVKHGSVLLAKKSVSAAVNELRVAWDAATKAEAIKNDKRWAELGILCQFNHDHLSHEGDGTAVLS